MLIIIEKCQRGKLCNEISFVDVAISEMTDLKQLSAKN